MITSRSAPQAGANSAPILALAPRKCSQSLVRFYAIVTDVFALRADQNSFLFLCDQYTEAECLQKHLVGTTQANALWAMAIKRGDNIYLLNFSTGTIRGPYTALTSTDCHDGSAWGGRFPIQVRIEKTNLTRQGQCTDPAAPPLLRKKRFSGALGEAATLVFSWLQRAGIEAN